MWYVSFVILTCFSTHIHLHSINDDKLIIETSTGILKGKEHDLDSDSKLSVYSYLGIPFAEAPVGPLRFEPPVPKTNWSGILDASNYGSSCMQGTIRFGGSEDCLFLNIFVPNFPSSSKLPVVVFIHGGAFLAGSGNVTNKSPDLILQKGIIFITIQYRLGILGFLSTNDEVVPGNNGLKDQICALRWIKRNIGQFGGDSDQITLFGQSAGAASVSYLLLSKQTENLYQRAIMNSGSALCLWSLYRRNWEVAKEIALNLGITAIGSRAVVEELKNVTAEVLQAEALKVTTRTLLLDSPLDGFPFTPSIEPNSDDGVITGKTHEIMQKGEFNKVPILIGHNSLEGSFYSNGFIRFYVLRYDVAPSGLVPIDMNLNNIFEKTIIGGRIRMKYFGFSPISGYNAATMNFVSDTEFIRPIQEFSKLWSKQAKVYYYVFSYEGNPKGDPNDIPGTAHTEDLYYLFKFNKYVSTRKNDEISKKMVTLWTNFMKSGNPTPMADQNLDNVVWPNVEGDQLFYLNINESLEVEQNYRQNEMRFWQKLYERSGNGPYDTY